MLIYIDEAGVESGLLNDWELSKHLDDHNPEGRQLDRTVRITDTLSCPHLLTEPSLLSISRALGNICPSLHSMIRRRRL